MTVSETDRRRYRVLWRRLTQHAVEFCNDPSRDPADLRPTSGDTANWITPTGKKSDDWLCLAFAYGIRAYARQDTVTRRKEMAPAVFLLASMVGDLLDASDTPAPPPQPTDNVRPLRPRLDIDG